MGAVIRFHQGRCAPFQRQLVSRVGVGHIKMHLGRDDRVIGGALVEHDQRIPNLHPSMLDATVVVPAFPDQGRIEGCDEEVDQPVRVMDCEIGSDGLRRIGWFGDVVQNRSVCETHLWGGGSVSWQSSINSIMRPPLVFGFA